MIGALSIIKLTRIAAVLARLLRTIGPRSLEGLLVTGSGHERPARWAHQFSKCAIVYSESIKRELKKRLIFEFRNSENHSE